MADKYRTYWKGYLRLALVTIPVRMVTATRTDGQVSFHQVDRKSKQRIRYKKVVPDGREVDASDIVRGYEVEPGQYVFLEDEELDAVKIESKHTIELTQFVEACEIDPLYFDKPYYLLPDGDVAEEGYRVIRDALRAERKVGLGQLTLRGKENLVALHASGNGMLLETLRYDEEVKEADDVFADIGKGELRADMVEMAKDLIARKSASFDPDRYQNHYARALRDLVKEKIAKGGQVAVGEDEVDKPGTVVDFMEALRRSVAGADPKGAEAKGSDPKPRAPAARRGAAQREEPREAKPAPKRRKAG
jgi:DNA end-binding protein Ku